MVGLVVKVYVVLHAPLGVEKIFKKQDDAAKFCADRNTNMYVKTYGYMEYELE